MTKQQLREAICRIIKQELNEAAKINTTDKFDVIKRNGERIKGVKFIDMRTYVLNGVEKSLNDNDSVEKSTVNENAPAPSKPAPSTKPTVTPGKPGEKEGPRRPLGNPNVKPAPKASMKEAEMLKKIVKRFKSKQSMNEAGTTWAEGYETGYNEGYQDASKGKSNKFKTGMLKRPTN
jgi:hypothetical protein